MNVFVIIALAAVAVWAVGSTLIAYILYQNVNFWVGRLEARTRGFEESRAGLIQQIQDMAQQLSTLRVMHHADSDDRVRAEPVEPKPYSPEIQEFLSGLLTDEVRRMVEEEVEYHREQGLHDEQILKIISQDE